MNTCLILSSEISLTVNYFDFQVPTFKHGDVVVNESLAICHYLEVCILFSEQFLWCTSLFIFPFILFIFIFIVMFLFYFT